MNRKLASHMTRREMMRQDIAELTHSVRRAAGCTRSLANAIYDCFPDQIEAKELGFKPSFNRSRRLHKKLVKQALARGAALIV